MEKRTAKFSNTLLKGMTRYCRKASRSFPSCETAKKLKRHCATFLSILHFFVLNVMKNDPTNIYYRMRDPTKLCDVMVEAVSTSFLVFTRYSNLPYTLLIAQLFTSTDEISSCSFPHFHTRFGNEICRLIFIPAKAFPASSRFLTFCSSFALNPHQH